jgi:hypothetical protein
MMYFEVKAGNCRILVCSILLNIGKSELKMTETLWKNSLIIARYMNRPCKLSVSGRYSKLPIMCVDYQVFRLYMHGSMHYIIYIMWTCVNLILSIFFSAIVSASRRDYDFGRVYRRYGQTVPFILFFSVF